MAIHKAQIGFYGGVGSVTGANFMLDTGALKILVDCGLMQGDLFAKRENSKPFAYDPASANVLFVTHAHADHIGRIPKLVHDGFSGVIYSTPPTRALAEVMLRDAYRVMLAEGKRDRTAPLYEPHDIDRALSLWQTFDYAEKRELGDDVSVELRNAGHILGSAIIRFTRGGRSVVFTGDIGNIPQPLLDEPEVPTDADYMVMESVYGDRLHEGASERNSLLLASIQEAIKARGTLIIPAFSLERTQAMLFEINNFVETKAIEPIPVFLDSPLAIAVTDIYRNHLPYLRQSVQEQVRGGDDIFDFPKLSFTRTVEESKHIEGTPGPKIIIAGSGMSHGGRILGHEKMYLSDPATILLLVGYQTVGSVGRKLMDGARRVRIDGEEVHVRARIRSIQGYSGHADRDALIEFVARSAKSLKGVYVVMGEEKASLFLVQRLRDYLGLKATAPSPDELVDIEF